MHGATIKIIKLQWLTRQGSVSCFQTVTLVLEKWSLFLVRIRNTSTHRIAKCKVLNIIAAGTHNSHSAVSVKRDRYKGKQVVRVHGRKLHSWSRVVSHPSRPIYSNGKTPSPLHPDTN